MPSYERFPNKVGLASSLSVFYLHFFMMRIFGPCDLVSFFLCSPPDSWQMERCSLHVDSLMPAPKRLYHVNNCSNFSCI